MVFDPQNIEKKEGSFIFHGNITAMAHACLNKKIIKEFWNGFSFRLSELEMSESEEFIFSCGRAKKPSLDGASYAINVESGGFCVCAENEKDLLRGVMTLLDRIKAADSGEKTVLMLDCCVIRETPLVKNRMVHFCIFPETELWELRRFIRFCGALKYTHVVLEFWGMLRYDCLSALSWSNAYTKEEIKPIIREAGELGLEVIPMFNHWGHASAGRVMHGKHVVLDQDPTLQGYFSEDGWCWDISKKKVRDLLRRIRNELIELCGEGKYFHIGCDEAYNFEFTRTNMDFICDFINEICEEMALQKRRVIAWGDMFLYRHAHYDPKNKYTCNAPSSEVEKYLLEHLDKRVVIADWQYDAQQAPIETASVFTAAGFNCILCPWDRGKNQLNAALATVKEKKLDGYMHTTWHTLSKGTPYVLLAGMGGFEDIENYGMLTALTNTASLLRKVMPSDGIYERAGWAKKQIGIIT